MLIAAGLKADTAVDGNAPLLAAAGENCVETVALLLDHGADVNVQNSDGWTPLIKAASANLPDVARVLLEHGADWTSSIGSIARRGCTPAMAGREEIAGAAQRGEGAGNDGP